MYRAIPVQSRICDKHDRARKNAKQQQRIRDMKPGIDTTPPKTCSLVHLRTNLKREQLLEDRYMEIDRENRILLQKMSDIMRKPGFDSPIKHSKGRAPFSLNKDRRKHELIRITEDNQALLHRIQKTQPVYNHLMWEEGHRRNEFYLRNSCEYPVVLRQQSCPALPVTSETPDKLDELLYEEEARNGHYKTPEKKSKEEALQEANLNYVLKQGQKIGHTYYLVEMTTDGHTLTVSAYDGDTQHTMELLINEKNHRRLYKECGGDYCQLAHRLSIENGRLLLRPLQPSYERAPPNPGDYRVGVDIDSAGNVGVNIDRTTGMTVETIPTDAYGDTIKTTQDSGHWNCGNARYQTA